MPNGPPRSHCHPQTTHTLEGSASLPPVNITAGWTWVCWAAWNPTWLQGKLMVMTSHFSTSPTWAHGMGKSSAFKKEGLVYWVAKKNEKNLSFARKHPCNQTTLEFSLLLGNQSFYASPITFSSVVVSDFFQLSGTSLLTIETSLSVLFSLLSLQR